MEENFNNNQQPKMQEPKKKEPSLKTKRNKAKAAVITLSTIGVLTFGLQVYASTNGYGNVFFMIKNLITTGNPAGEQEIFSDKDITLSYKSIEVAEGLKIQANRLEIKDGKTKIYLSIKSESYNHLPLKYEISTTDNTGKLIKDKTRSMGIAPENDDDISYQEVITLDYEVGDNDIIVIKIIDKMDKELRTLEINLQTREITIKGEKDFEKISEIELKKYLNLFSALNNGISQNDNLLYMAETLIAAGGEYEGYGIIPNDVLSEALRNNSRRELVNKIIKEMYGDNAKFEMIKNAQGKDVEVLKGEMAGWKYDKQNDSYSQLTAGEDYHYGRCLKIEDVKFENDIYTIKYVYMLLTDNEQMEANINNNLEDLPQYETTIKLKRKEDNTYSKYEIVSLEKGTEIKNKVSTDVSDDLDNKQSSTGIWYTIDLYENNEIKIRFTSNDFDKMFGNIKGDRTKSYDIVGINGKVKKIYQSNNGTSVDPMTFFLLENGTIQYILPFEQITNEMPTSFKIDGTIEQVKDAVEIKTNNNDVVIAVLKNGQEVKIWNQFMENWGENETESTNNTNTETSSNTTNNTSNSTTNTSQNTHYSREELMELNNWIEYWPDVGMKFKLPKSFEQGQVSEVPGNISVNMSGHIVLPILHYERETDSKYEGVPVRIELYTEIHDNNVNMWDVLENSQERSVKSTDNKQWSDWYPLKDESVPTNAPNGYIRRSYGRVRGDMIEKVIFDMQTDNGMDTPHYEFIRNVLETVTSTSR